MTSTAVVAAERAHEMNPVVEAQPVEIELHVDVHGEGTRLSSEGDSPLLGVNLTQIRGVVVRQESQILQAMAQFVGLPYEARNRYKISALPPGKRVGGGGRGSSRPPYESVGSAEEGGELNGETGGEEWWPSNKELAELPTLLHAHEESPCVRRTLLTMLGCNAQRCLKMHFFEPVAATTEEEDGETERVAFPLRAFSLRRPLRLGMKTAIPICVGLGELAYQAVSVASGREDEGLLSLVGLASGLLLGLALLALAPDRLRLRMVVGAPDAQRAGGPGDVWNDVEIGLVEEALEPSRGAFSAPRKCAVCCCCCTNYSRLVELEAPRHKGAGTDELASTALSSSAPLASASSSASSSAAGVPAGTHVFTTRANMCCCGAHNNCCAATCCRERFVMDILDARDNDAVVSQLVRTYAPGGCSAFCRCYNGFSQYLVEFPEGATQNQRILLLASFISTDLEFFDNNQ